MKFALACVVFAVCLAKLQAAPSESATAYPNMEEGMKKVADFMADMTKKFEESTGLHGEFDKEKFLKLCKSMMEKLTDFHKNFKDMIDTNLKNVPAPEEIKKKMEDVSKQLSEAMKNLNSPEVSKSFEKMRETCVTSAKKMNEAYNEFASKLGIALPTSMQKVFNEMADEIVKSSKSFQEKFMKLLEEAQKELQKKKN